MSREYSLILSRAQRQVLLEALELYAKERGDMVIIIDPLSKEIESLFCGEDDGEIPVSKLLVGQRVDLEGDKYADNGNHPEFENEYEVVQSITEESRDCILVEFASGFTCGFPPDHLVVIDQDQYF